MSRRRSIRLRLALASAALVAACLAALLALVYWGTLASARRAMDERLRAEVAELDRHRAEGGMDALVVELERRVRVVGRDGEVYLLQTGSRRVLAGNLAAWPPDISAAPGVRWAVLEEFEPRGDSRRLRVQVRELAEGGRLLVGRPSDEHDSLAGHLRAALGIGLGAAILLAIGAGLALSHGLLRRVHGMTATVWRVRAGERSQRVPLGARRDEFDELAAAFNQLLDENEALLSQVRGIADDVAHDLRTPLTRLRGRVETTLAAPRSADEYAESLADIRAELDDVLTTFQALLAITQVESADLRARMTRVELAPLVRDAVELYEPAAEEAGAALVAEVDGDPAVTGEPQLLTQALTNLIDNALKYGAGPITVFARRAGDRVELGVADRGPGVPEADRSGVLRRFARLDAARSQPGTGLGLAFVGAVARAHGARLELSDANPGLVVTLTLPVERGG